METEGSQPGPGRPVAAESAPAVVPNDAARDIARLAAFVEWSDDAFIASGLDGTIEYWNAAAQRLYGYTREEAIGGPISILVPPAALDDFNRLLGRVRQGERISSFEAIRVGKHGSRVHVALRIAPIRDSGGGITGFSFIARDMFERDWTRAVISRSDARMHAIFDTAVDAIVIIDGRGFIQSVNPATERMFGYSAPELLGENVTILMPAPYRDQHDAFLTRYAQTGEKHVIGVGREAMARRKDGTVFAIQLAVSEVEPGALYTGVIRDVTEVKLAQKAVRESERLAAIGHMARGIGHDLGNILQDFLMDLHVLDKCPLPPAGVEAVRSIRASVGYLRDLSQGLQQASMDLMNNGAGAARSTRLTEWWPAVAALLKAASRPGVVLEPSITPGLPAVQMAPHQLTQAVFNLVSNSYHAIEESKPAGGGVIKFVAAPKPGGVRLQVVDNGRGMPPEVLARVFEPHFTTRAGRGGTGLGLPLVKRMITDAGGDVSVESKPGFGTTVTLDLPFAPAGAPPAGAGEAVSAAR